MTDNYNNYQFMHQWQVATGVSAAAALPEVRCSGVWLYHSVLVLTLNCIQNSASCRLVNKTKVSCNNLNFNLLILFISA